MPRALNSSSVCCEREAPQISILALSWWPQTQMWVKMPPKKSVGTGAHAGPSPGSEPPAQLVLGTRRGLRKFWVRCFDLSEPRWDLIWSGAFCLDSQFQPPNGELENEEVDASGDSRSHRITGRLGCPACTALLVLAGPKH